ncbi:GlxA family transcriptional regulator [Pseudomonas sp. 21LCFQ010]|uniref:GlxA family transcriptional regulator n=1 Tax=Pseudomonas sp. 21LCFQ010 TaxID=2957506 RepID=UPI0020982279|nr:GlxA family transcriptional regulator [Pseudomonas sp. 21LCFQ010]MCO8166146.1 GlxA family transcriptional regulator [Pseudomonas sp. 21LCFQ010]
MPIMTTAIDNGWCETIATSAAQHRAATHAAQRTANIGFLLLDNFSLPCFTQALDVLTTANLIRPGSVKVHTFGYRNSEVMSDLAIPIRPNTPLTDIRIADLDLMMVCGGLRTPRQVPDWLVSLLKKLAGFPITLGGLWNGAWYLGRAGLLDGYRCAIHSEQRTALSERSPNANVSLDSMVFDRDRLTAATPAGAFEVMRKWLAKACEPDLAEAVTSLLDYDHSRFQRTSESPRRKLCKPLRELITLMQANLEEPLEPEQLAHYAGLSKRQIQRLFREQLGTSPQKYYLQLRLNESRRLIQNSTFSMLEVAIACGFVSGSHFSKCYSDVFGYPPSREVRHEV